MFSLKEKFIVEFIRKKFLKLEVFQSCWGLLYKIRIQIFKKSQYSTASMLAAAPSVDRLFMVGGDPKITIRLYN